MNNIEPLLKGKILEDYTIQINCIVDRLTKKIKSLPEYSGKKLNLNLGLSDRVTVLDIVFKGGKPALVEHPSDDCLEVIIQERKLDSYKNKDDKFDLDKEEQIFECLNGTNYVREVKLSLLEKVTEDVKEKKASIDKKEISMDQLKHNYPLREYLISKKFLEWFIGTKGIENPFIELMKDKYDVIFSGFLTNTKFKGKIPTKELREILMHAFERAFRSGELKRYADINYSKYMSHFKNEAYPIIASKLATLAEWGEVIYADNDFNMLFKENISYAFPEFKEYGWLFQKLISGERILHCKIINLKEKFKEKTKYDVAGFLAGHYPKHENIRIHENNIEICSLPIYHFRYSLSEAFELSEKEKFDENIPKQLGKEFLYSIIRNNGLFKEAVDYVIEYMGEKKFLSFKQRKEIYNNFLQTINRQVG